jgi:hypothetical protein
MGIMSNVLDQATTDRINAKVDRLNARIIKAEEINKAARARLDREAAEREIARREATRAIQADAVDRYHPWGASPPPPISGESAGRYRRRLLADEQRYLAPGDPFSSMRAPNLAREDSATLAVLEPRIHEAFARALTDPATVPPGELRPIHLDDPRSGARITSWVGRESFIKSMGQPCRKVVGGVDGGLRRLAELNSTRR